MYTEQRPKGLPLTENERNLIAYMLKKGYNQTAIAKELGVWPSTICREIKRGQVEQLNGSTWEYYTIYSPQKAQGRAEYMRTAHGPDLKVSNRFDYLAALESWMLSGSSPEDAIHQVGNDYGITISKTTCYRYIEMKLFSTLRFKHLPQGHPKTGKSGHSHSNVSHPGHRSIERRAKEVQTRESVGHWEIDSVIGKASGQSESLLVISERKTRRNHPQGREQDFCRNRAPASAPSPVLRQ